MIIKPIENYPDFSLLPEQAAKRFMELLADLSPECDLKLKRGDKENLGDGLFRERIEYEVTPGETVAAFLFTHADGNPRPAILSIHGHGGEAQFPEGKKLCCDICDEPKKYSYHLARAGFTVLTPDALCFGERQITEGYSRNFSAEILCAMELMCRGKSFAWKSIYDNMRALDVMELLPEVDRHRIGYMGQSGGSIQGYLLMPCDQRIKAAVLSQSFITLRHQFYEYGLCHCLYPYVPGIITAGIDFDQLIASVVPRKVMMLRGEKDEGTPRIMAESFVKAIEAESDRQGVSPCVELFTSPGGHPLTTEMINAAITFLNQKLIY